jgi:transcriptional regulator with XRE-family HTH domain
VRRGGKTGETSGQDRNTPHPADIHVGQRLRERRIVMGISQHRLATIVGLTFQQVYKYEQGKNRVSAGRLYDFSKVLGVPVGFFFEGMAEPLPAAALVSGGGNSLLDSREATELFAAYRVISNPMVRRRIRQLVRALASEPNDSTEKSTASENRRPLRRVRNDRGGRRVRR